MKSSGFIQVGLQAKTPKYEPWSAVVIPRFCYWINTSAWSPRLRAAHRKQLAGEAWVKQSPDPYHQPCQGSSSPSGRLVCDSGLDPENLPWLSGCAELAGEVWLQLLIFCWLTWDGLDKEVLLLQVTPVLLWEQFLEKPKCSPSRRTASQGTEGSSVLQLCNRLKRENYFMCHLWKLSL